jgi:hypothetical protein
MNAPEDLRARTKKYALIKPTLVQPLREETNELIAILVTITKKVKTRRQRDG